MRIEIKKTSDIICSCNSCGARNYGGEIELYSNARKVDTLYDVRIGGMVNNLCPECLAGLIGKAAVALASGEASK